MFETLKYKPCTSGAWSPGFTTPPHVITAQSGVQYLDVSMDPGCACFDYRLEIYRVDPPTGTDTLDWSNDPDLHNHHEEWLAQDCGGLMLCDFDANCVIDLADYTPMRGCWAGPNRPPHPDPPLTAPQCLGVYDADQDGDVDLMTFAYFQNHYRRPPSP